MPVYYLCSMVFSVIYLCVRTTSYVHPLIMISYFGFTLLVIAVTTIFINKIRYLLNLISLIFLYGLQLLNNSVEGANWVGAAFMALLYIQMIANIFIMWLERRNFRLYSLD